MEFKQLIFKDNNAVADFGIVQEKYSIIQEYNLYSIMYTGNNIGRITTNFKTIKDAEKASQIHFNEQCKKIVSAIITS